MCWKGENKEKRGREWHIFKEKNTYCFASCRSWKVPLDKSSTANGWFTPSSRTRFWFRATPTATCRGATPTRASGSEITNPTRPWSCASPATSLDRFATEIVLTSLSSRKDRNFLGKLWRPIFIGHIRISDYKVWTFKRITPGFFNCYLNRKDEKEAGIG